MNILHLKYAVEVEKTSSITKAAENLFMGQPNLSRSIKDLEETLGIKIFRRTSKGIVPTVQGEEFLTYAKSILAQIDEMEALYKHDVKNKISFSISVPRSGYITHAFTRFVSKLDRDKEIEINYKETNAVRAINNILQSNYNLGIIRYPMEYEHHFQNMLESKDMKSEIIAEFGVSLLASKSSPLCLLDNVTAADLNDLIEVCHGDPFIPTLSSSDIKKAESLDKGTKHIYVYERGSQFDLLREVATTYMWASVVPQHVLERNDLAIIKAPGLNDKRYKDVLISNRNYRFSMIDRLFTECLKTAVEETAFSDK